MAEEPKIAVRSRTFLKGTLYYDNRRASIDCVIRDMSDSGARLTLDHPATVPDNVELFIPHKQQTLRACVQRRGPNEIGIAFEIDRSLEPRRASGAAPRPRRGVALAHRVFANRTCLLLAHRDNSLRCKIWSLLGQ
jgi:PilZ domain